MELLEDRLVPTAGAVDPTFGHNGTLTLDTNYVAKAVVVEGDEKIVVLAQSGNNFEILRFNTNGKADNTFSGDGKVTGTWGNGTNVVSLAVLGDGSVLVGGSHTAQQPPPGLATLWYADVAEYNSDGTINSNFGTAGLAEISLPGADAQSANDHGTTGMAVDGNGNIVVVASTFNVISVIRLTPRGSEDSGFGGTGIVTTTVGNQSGGLAIQSDNKIVVTAFSNGNLELLRYDTNGSLDSTFGPDGVVSAPLAGQNFAAAQVAVQATDGALIVTADSYTVTPYTYTWWDGTQDQTSTYYTTTAYFDLFRFHADGTADTNFGKAGQVEVSSPAYYEQSYAPVTHSLALQDDGKVLVAGNAYYGSTYVTRYNTDGTVDLTYGNGGTASTNSWWYYGQQGSSALALQGDGKVVLAATSSVWVKDAYVPVLTLARFQADSDIRPAQFGSEAAFRDYLIQQAIQQYQWEFGQTYTYWGYYPGLAAGTGGNVSSVAGAPTGNSGNSFSGTNDQTQGVDEGDTVKTDGQYLYVLSNNKLVILNAWPANQLSTVSTTALDGNVLAEYLIGNRVTVISQLYNYPVIDPPIGPVMAGGTVMASGAMIARPWPWFWGNPQVEVTVYDVSDPKNPALVQETKYDGYYNTSRSIGSTVYVALNNNLSLPPPQYTIQDNQIVYETEEQYRARMEALPLEPLLPHYTTYTTDADGGTVTDTELLTTPESIYQAGVPGDTNLVSVVSLNPTNGVGGPTNGVTFLTSYGATLYASADNFYLATTRWSYVNDWTFIDKISLQDGGLDLTATGRVPGTIMNQFSMGENGTYFYIATTSGWWHDSSNNVFVLNESAHSLNLVGSLVDFAHGESITSVRFMDDRGFVSTSLNVDPLFAIDLSNPAAPTIAGQLTVPGYTGYLQLLDAGHLLGIGQEPGSGTGNWGVVITLFDITNLNHPSIISRYHVSPNGWSWTDATYDYHAITYYPQYQTLALPVSSNVQVPDPSGTGTQWVYDSDELIFHVDPVNGLTLQGKVSDLSQISRGVFINNVLYTISDTSVQAHALENLTQLIAQTPLPTPTPPWWWPWWQQGWDPILPLKVNADAKIKKHVRHVHKSGTPAPGKPGPRLTHRVAGGLR